MAAAAPRHSEPNKAVGALKSRYLVGLQLYTVRDDCAKDFPGVIKAVGKMGFTGVEFAGYYGRSAQELRAMLDESHLKCYGTHIGMDTMLGDNFEKTVEFNKILGNKLLVIPWIDENKRNTPAAIKETAKTLNEIAKKLEPHGMILAYHCHKGDFITVNGFTSWELLFKSTDDRVKIQFDSGNAMSAGVQGAPMVAKFPGRIISVHFKDFSSTNPNALLGEGDEDWKSLVPMLKKTAGVRWYIIEQESYPFPPLECAEKCLRTFEKLMNSK